MIDTLDFLVRFWELRVRFEQFGGGLADSERFELISLLPMVSSTSVAIEPDNLSASDERGIPIQLTAGSGFLAADLRELRADGLIVGAAEPIAAGTRTIAHVADAVSGVEYSLPCIVAWAHQAEPWLMGLALDGAPTREEFVAPIWALMRSPWGYAAQQVQA